MKRWLLVALGALSAALGALLTLVLRLRRPKAPSTRETLEARYRAEQAEDRWTREARQREYEIAKGRVIVERDRRLQDPAPTWQDVEALEQDLEGEELAGPSERKPATRTVRGRVKR